MVKYLELEQQFSTKNTKLGEFSIWDIFSKITIVLSEEQVWDWDSIVVLMPAVV